MNRIVLSLFSGWPRTSRQAGTGWLRWWPGKLITRHGNNLEKLANMAFVRESESMHGKEILMKSEGRGCIGNRAVTFSFLRHRSQRIFSTQYLPNKMSLNNLTRGSHSNTVFLLYTSSRIKIAEKMTNWSELSNVELHLLLNNFQQFKGSFCRVC